MFAKIAVTILKVLLPLAVLGGAAFKAYDMYKSAPVPESRAGERLAPLVEVLEAVPGSVRLDVSTYGTVRPRSRTRIVPQVPGIVVSIHPALLEGAFLDADEVLLRIDPRDYELAVTQAQADVARAKAVLDRAKAEAAVAKQEFEEFGRGPASPLVLKEPQLREAEALLASAEARLTKTRIDLERTVVKAPYDCRVRSESVDLGQFVAVGVPVAEVYSTDFAEVRLSVPDDQVAFVELPLASSLEGDPANGGGGPSAPEVFLDAVFGGETHRFVGRIVRTEAELDPRTRVVHAIARVPDPYARKTDGRPPLLPGMYVRATIPGRGFDAVFAVPRRAMRGRDRLLVVDAEDRLEYRPVEVLRAEEGRVLISGGLKAGERICLTELDPVVPGATVRVHEEDER